MLYSITSYDERGCSVSISPPTAYDIIQYGIFEGLEYTLEVVELILKRFVDDLKDSLREELGEYTVDEICENFKYEAEQYKKTLIIAELDGEIGKVLKQTRFAKFKNDGTLKWC